MEKVQLYIKESYNELTNKVTWPTWSSLLSSTRLVIVASIIFALILFVMDLISKQSLNLIYPSKDTSFNLIDPLTDTLGFII